MGIFELMCVDRDLQNLIRSGQASPGDLRGAAEKKGMRGLLEDGIDKVFSGATSLSEIMSAVG